MRSRMPITTTTSSVEVAKAVVTLATEATRAVTLDSVETKAATLDMVETKVVILDTRLVDDGKACIAEMARESGLIL